MAMRLVFVICMIAAFIGGMAVTSSTPAASQPVIHATATTIPVADNAEEVVIGVYERMSPTVVNITTVRHKFNINYGTVPQEGTGSGVIIREQGYILTNNHVIKGALKVTVTFFDGSVEEATVVGTDQFTDLAILKVAMEMDPSWVAPLGDSDALRVGQRAIAIGNPFGFHQTLSVGVISALGRPIKTPETQYDDMIQSDASINPGNSGGPLINSAGEVIGLNTSIFSKTGTSLGIGFAIPSNTCKKIAQDIIDHGYVRRAYLGASGFSLNQSIARTLGVSVNRGVLVQQVIPNSPADKAGFRAGTKNIQLRYGLYTKTLVLGGDIILAFDGQVILTQQQLDNLVKRKSPGDTVKIVIFRGMSTKEIEVKLEMEP